MSSRHPVYAPVGQYQTLHVSATGTAIGVGNAVDTTSATSIPGGGASTVVATTATTIRVNQMLDISGGTGTAETVQVTAVVPGASFTAVFANAHSGAYHITSKCGTKYGGITINKVGSSDIITIYNGSPNAPKTAIVGVIASPAAGATYHPWGSALDQGLYFTVAGTAGDYTIAYADDPLGA